MLWNVRVDCKNTVFSDSNGVIACEEEWTLESLVDLRGGTVFENCRFEFITESLNEISLLEANFGADSAYKCIVCEIVQNLKLKLGKLGQEGQERSCNAEGSPQAPAVLF